MLLSIKNICKSFGGLQVLTNINTIINPGEIVGLIGPNGAGKSTLFNIITGIYSPSSGLVQLGQRDLKGLAPHVICRLGISRTFQLVKIFPSLSALDNVRVGALFGRKKNASKTPPDPVECLEIVGLGDRTKIMSSHLTFCDRRRVEMARAIAAGPELLLLDEPLAGLNDSETLEMTEVIGKIREEMKTAIFWVEHKIEAVFSLCDRMIVLDFGQKIAEGTPDEVAGDDAVIEAYLGRGWEPLNA